MNNNYIDWDNQDPEEGKDSFDTDAKGTYMIRRFFKDDRETIEVKSGLTLEEAKKHCNDPETESAEWFDGYQLEE